MLHQISYRPYPQGRIQTPVKVRSAGHYIIDQTWAEDIDRRPILQFFWALSGTGKFDGTGGSPWYLTKNMIGCFLPGDRHCIRAETPEFDYWWFTLDGPEVESLIHAFRLPRGERPAGPCPVKLFEQLFHEVSSPNINSELAAGATAYQILTASLQDPSGDEHSLVLQFKKLVAAQCSSPDFSVEEIARQLGIHRSTLVRAIGRYCGESPKEYLVGQRLSLALGLLRNSSCSIKEIAEQSGFSSANYFSKVFRQRFGHPPKEMRTP